MFVFSFSLLSFLSDYFLSIQLAVFHFRLLSFLSDCCCLSPSDCCLSIQIVVFPFGFHILLFRQLWFILDLMPFHSDGCLFCHIPCLFLLLRHLFLLGWSCSFRLLSLLAECCFFFQIVSLSCRLLCLLTVATILFISFLMPKNCPHHLNVTRFYVML